MATNADDLKSPNYWRSVVAEFIGTMLLVFVGCGSCMNWGHDNEPTVVQIALSFGLSVATIVWIIAHISGGHINPAVTMSMLVTRKITFVRALMYIISQCCGAITGSAILMGLTPPEIRGGLGLTTINNKLSPIRGFGIELLITFVLVSTVFATCDSKRTDTKGSGPLAIGLSVTVCHLFAIRYTGSSMNPARTFGPAVVTGVWEEHWIYWLGPLVGGMAAGILYDTVFDSSASMSKAKALLTSTYDPNESQKKKNQNNNNNFDSPLFEEEKPTDVHVME